MLKCALYKLHAIGSQSTVIDPGKGNEAQKKHSGQGDLRHGCD